MGGSLMKVTEQILSQIEGNSEQEPLNSIQEKLNIRYERNARIMQHVLANDPEKYTENLIREINKLEKKIQKEYKKVQKRMDSFNSSFSPDSQRKIYELQKEAEELKAFI